MKPTIPIKYIFSTLFVVLLLLGYSTGSALGAYNCINGAQDPPFLSAGVKPNLLLLIDNSASMYDMAYTGDSANCYDGTDYDAGTESYVSTNEYGGYFRTNTWYEYNKDDSIFEAMTAPGECRDPGDLGEAYQLQGELCVIMTPDQVAFKARGNFINWATASKFDIQKQVLTGGKFTSARTMISEGRGCSGNRFVKQIQVFDSSPIPKTNYLNLGVHPLKAFDPNATEDTSDPTTAIDVFQINETGFNNTSCDEAVALMQDEKTPLGTLKILIDECMEYDKGLTYTSAEGPAFNQAVQSCWYWDKHGFPEMTLDERAQHAVSIRNHCETMYEFEDPSAIDPSSPGYVCAEEYVGRCWVPAVTSGPSTCEKVACEVINGDEVYTSDDPEADPEPLPDGERCNADGIVEYCAGNYNPNSGRCNKEPWLIKTTPPGCEPPVVTEGYWVEENTDFCVTEALRNFCGEVTIPGVVDPSDQTTATGEVYNLPAMLTDTGISGQLGDPLLTMKGIIRDNVYETERPTGILHKVANNIRMGAMAFNYDGARTECSLRDEDLAAADAADENRLTNILYKCDGTTIDGGAVIADIDNATSIVDATATPNLTHIDDMVEKINEIRADAWTPLAEAVFNAIGYYTQRSDMRLNEDDFEIFQPPEGDQKPQPCTDWCQNNNILVITEGASTADLHATVTTFATVEGQNDPDNNDDAVKCNDLYGSTYLDDITYYGFHGHDIHKEGDAWTENEHFQNIRTYFVVAGTPRNQGTGECNPYQMMFNAAENGGTTEPYIADSPGDLKDKLGFVLDAIGGRAAAGSAASVISATRGGKGAIYQAIFWPSIDGPQKPLSDELKHEVTWAGEVHSLLVDAYGKMFEDTDGDHALTSADKQVVLYYDEDLGRSMVCYQELEDNGTCGIEPEELNTVKYLWSAAEWLADIPDTAIATNRTSIGSDTKKRFIYTWNDLDNNGIVADSEMLPFEPRSDWNALSVTNRAPVPIDFGINPQSVDASDQVNRIINWVRGLDDPDLRPREVPRPDNFDITGSPATITWRLGDVVHSTPTAVSRPAEGYHQLYKDASYAEYFNTHQHRHHVVYFGGNDGMVHAINAGFYDDNTQAFRKNFDGENFSDTGGHELGAELWAYVPYNLLPHLKCLTATGYQHKYFVDLKPRIFDVQIFEGSPDTLGHVKGWGTIMVIGMRFGGARTLAQDIIDDLELTETYTDSRVFTSAYMVFDISDPLSPRLLGEMTFDPGTSVDLAYTAAIPTVVPIKKPKTLPTDPDQSDWYLILGSGPTDVSGVSNQTPKIGVFPLSQFDTPSAYPFRMPAPGNSTINHATAGSYNLVQTDTNGVNINGFVADTVTVDYDLVEEFKADVVYFGTVEGDWGNWGGHLYRWVTNGGHPESWSPPAPMINAGRPVTAAPTIGYDGFFYWVYFGTGRFFDVQDKSDNVQEYFFGLKEPVDPSKTFVDSNTDVFTWEPIANAQVNVKPITGNDAGSRTLLPVGDIQVEKATNPAFATLNCETGADGCLPSGVSTFADLQEYIVGTCDSTDGCTGTDGWVMALEDIGERNLGQGALLGGLMTFTTYKPFEDICKPEGYAYLYGVYYQTGTAFYEPVFTTTSPGNGTYTGDAGTTVVTSRLAIGRGLAMTPNLHVGRQEGSTAFVQTSTGTIVEIPQPNLPIKNTKSGKLTWQGTCE